MSTTLVKEDGILWEVHDFHVHRFNDDVPFQQRTHAETLGRFDTMSTALVELEERKHPENLHIETRTEYVEVQCNCGTTQEDFNGGWIHYDDCRIIKVQYHYNFKE